MPLPFSPTTDYLEASSTRYGRDRFSLRLLTSGNWAVYGNDFSLIAIVPRIEDVPDIPELAEDRRRADEARRKAEDEALWLRQRAEARAALDSLELDLDDL